jgi:predicted transcriptional regulator
MAKDAATVAQRWVDRLASAGDKITQGVQGVTVAPGAAAARQVAVWAANTAAAQGKFARNVAAVPLSTWQQATITKGIPRIASGAAAAHDKMVAFMTKFLPYVMSAKASLPARGSYEQNKARMVAMVDAVHKFQK